ncbi:hypothetical protein RAD15_22945 [Bradyrhizobium sp. 14AA]
MFDHLIRALRDLEGTHEVSVPLKAEPDAEGYVDKECPNKECLFLFKIHQEDWRNIVRDEQVFCPSCGHDAPAKSWWTTDQVKWAQKVAVRQLSSRLDDAMEQDSYEWNRRQPRNAFIRMTMNVTRTPKPVLLPIGATDSMRLKVTCNACQCRFSVIGSAYFCPSCGVSSADHVFGQSLDKIEAALNALPLIRSSLEDADAAANTTNLLIENSIVQSVMAFQRFAEAMWSRIPNVAPARRNVFQNLTEGSTLWQSAVGKGYDGYLTPPELTALVRYFQQRHLLAHREGLVDEDYLTRSGDTAYRLGQRLVIREAAAGECVALVRKLGAALQAAAEASRP